MKDYREIARTFLSTVAYTVKAVNMRGRVHRGPQFVEFYEVKRHGGDGQQAAHDVLKQEIFPEADQVEVSWTVKHGGSCAMKDTVGLYH